MVFTLVIRHHKRERCLRRNDSHLCCDNVRGIQQYLLTNTHIFLLLVDMSNLELDIGAG